MKAIDQQIGRRLSVARQELGLTVTQAAESVGLSWQQIAMFEEGWTRPSPGVLLSLSRLYRVGLPELFRDFDCTHETAPSLRTLLHPLLRRPA